MLDNLANEFKKGEKVVVKMNKVTKLTGDQWPTFHCPEGHFCGLHDSNLIGFSDSKQFFNVVTLSTLLQWILR